MLFYVTCTDSFAMVNKEGIGNNRFIFSLVSMQAVLLQLNEYTKNSGRYTFTIAIK